MELVKIELMGTKENIENLLLDLVDKIYITNTIIIVPKKDIKDFDSYEVKFKILNSTNI